LVADTLLAIRQRFGAVSCETQTIRGMWEHQDQTYRDDLVRLFVDVPDIPDSRLFFRGIQRASQRAFQAD